jgi:hypothetical protein
MSATGQVTPFSNRSFNGSNGSCGLNIGFAASLVKAAILRPPSSFGAIVATPSPSNRGQRRKAMGHSEYDPGANDRRPWNAGRKLAENER